MEASKILEPVRLIRVAKAGRGGRSLQNAPPNDKMLPEKSGRGFGMKLNLGKWLVVAAAMAVSSWAPARADVVVQIDKSSQRMSVSVDGAPRYNWPVSTGGGGYGTPSGVFQPQSMARMHYSRKYYNSPMPHSIFFTKVGHAIHGTDSESRLGTPASHGCVRLSRANASTLYTLVKEDGVLNTTVTLTGSSQIALMRNPPTRSNAAVTNRGQDDTYAPQDSSNVVRYPAPRNNRRLYDAQVNPQTQYQYYDNRGYYGRQYGPQVYAPRPYYQPRGVYTYRD